MDKPNPKPQNIVAMTDFRAEVGYTALPQVEAYWDSLRGLRPMPKRSEIDPRGIESALEYTFVLERIAPGMARMRIAGSHLSDLMGMDVRGMPITSLITPPCRRQISDALEEVFQRPAVCELRLSSSGDANRPQMEGRLLLLPLKSDLGDVSRIMGCLVSKGDLGTSPRRFDVVGANIRPITPAATVVATEPEEREKQPAPQPATGFAEASRPFDPSKGRRDVPYLRLVKSDD